MAPANGVSVAQALTVHAADAHVRRGKTASGACREIWHVQELYEEVHGPGGIP